MDVYDTTTFKLQPKISGEYILLHFMICVDLHHFDVSITLLFHFSVDETDAPPTPSNLSFMEKV